MEEFTILFVSLDIQYLLAASRYNGKTSTIRHATDPSSVSSSTGVTVRHSFHSAEVNIHSAVMNLSSLNVAARVVALSYFLIN
ncbi:unnamed protein product [Calypogeia fissa]